MPMLDRHGFERVGPPAAVCCVCGRFGWITQIGAPCHWCGVGVYFKPKWFDFYLCSTCFNKYLMCKDCHGKGIVAVPRQDVTQEEVETELAAMEARRSRPPAPVFQPPEPGQTYDWKGKRARRRRR